MDQQVKSGNRFSEEYCLLGTPHDWHLNDRYKKILESYDPDAKLEADEDMIKGFRLTGTCSSAGSDL